MNSQAKRPALRRVSAQYGDPRNPTTVFANQTAIRDAFWEAHPQFTRRGTRVRQNAYNATIRTAFVDYVDSLARNGEISASLAERVTL